MVCQLVDALLGAYAVLRRQRGAVGWRRRGRRASSHRVDLAAGTGPVRGSAVSLPRNGERVLVKPGTDPRAMSKQFIQHLLHAGDQPLLPGQENSSEGSANGQAALDGQPACCAVIDQQAI